MATTFLLTGVARQIALRYGAVAKVRARDVHKVPIPYFGGLSILGGLIAGFAVASSLPFLGNSLQVAHDARAILLGGGVICPSPAQLAVLTAGILLVSCNAVNFVDGLDGLAAGVTAIGATAFFV